MSQEQLARRLDVTRQSVASLERGESSGKVTLRALRNAAEALNCELVVALVPRQPLEHAVNDRARAKALAERDRLIHTMRLEAQDESVGDALSLDADTAKWLTERRSELWD